MSLIEIEWHPTERQLRVFGVSGLLASAGVALLLHFVWGTAAVWTVLVIAAGVGLFLCSLVSPAATRILYLGLTIPVLPIGLAVSFVLLAGFYFLVITPLALVFRLIGRDPLRRCFDATAKSYWTPHRPSDETERYLHQF